MTINRSISARLASERTIDPSYGRPVPAWRVLPSRDGDLAEQPGGPHQLGGASLACLRGSNELQLSAHQLVEQGDNDDADADRRSERRMVESDDGSRSHQQQQHHARTDLVVAHETRLSLSLQEMGWRACVAMPAGMREPS